MAVHCNISLFNITAEELLTNTAVCTALQSLATIASLMAMAFILYSKLHRHFPYRLILYLMAANAFYAISVMMETVPVTYSQDKGVCVREGWEKECAAIAYISQMTESAKLTLIAWIVVYLLVLAVFKLQIDKPRYEIVGLLITLAVPLFKDWLPLAWNMYGLSGMWCWITLVDDNCTPQYPLGIGLMFGVEYGPVLLMGLFTAVSCIIILCRLHKDAAKAEISWRGVTDSSALKAGLPLIAFPVLYMLIFLFRIAHRTYYMIKVEQTTSPFTTFWLLHTIAIGLATLIVPMVFICNTNTLKGMCVCLYKDRRLPLIYRHDSLSGSKEICSSTESDPFLPKYRNSRDSLVYKSILSSVPTSLQN